MKGPKMNVNGKVAIVTGAGGDGCGRAIACRLARKGAAVVVADLRDLGVRDTVNAIEAEGGRTAGVPTDVGNEADVRALFEFAEQTFGGVDIVVNDASGAVVPETSLDHWFANLRVDMLGGMYGTRYGIESMRRRGGGAIVNIGSTSALPHGGRLSKAPGYDAAKAGIIRLTTCLAYLAEAEGIHVNCLVPHWIGTPHIAAFVATLTPELRREWSVPDVLITPDEIAGAVLRLATDRNLAGRVLVWWGGQPPRLIAVGDPGFASLEAMEL
ncbi:MAG TPA: SDR family oxidoreductase [Isosphaeraceae bacterium]|nr:SDR family oxidoreductase [Isosphaeraceae bacterium]